MPESFQVIDCDAGRGWVLSDRLTAVRYAAARHAATGGVVEVLRVAPPDVEHVLVLPPSAPDGRR